MGVPSKVKVCVEHIAGRVGCLLFGRKDFYLPTMLWWKQNRFGGKASMKSFLLALVLVQGGKVEGDTAERRRSWINR